MQETLFAFPAEEGYIINDPFQAAMPKTQHLITESEIEVLTRRLNHHSELGIYAQLKEEAENNGLQLTVDHTKRELDYLTGLYLNGLGEPLPITELTTSEINILETGVDHAEYIGSFPLVIGEIGLYVPLYKIVDIEGFSFEYYTYQGKVRILD